MSKDTRILGVVGCVLGIWGCHGDTNLETAQAVRATTTTSVCQGEGQSEFCFEVSDVAASLGTCQAKRFVGKRAGNPNAACPTPGTSGNGQWQSGRLFANNGQNAPDALKRYCVYDWRPAPSLPNAVPDHAALPTESNRPSGDWLAPDCEVIGGSGAYADALAGELQTAFHDAVNHVSVLPSATNLTGATYVSVLDTAVDTAPPAVGTGINVHGRTMGLIVESLACPSGAGSQCAGGVDYVLALPRSGDGSTADTVNGGDFGSFSDLASAIYRAHQRAVAAGRTRVILNLSVAWDGAYGGAYTGTDWTGQLSSAVASVREAIGYVTCQGGIVIAAAGNITGPSATGLMYPAAWETKNRPDSDECDDYNLSAPPSATTTYTPLVYAVGSVDPKDMVSMDARQDGMPSFVAPGQHAVVNDFETSTPSKLYSGSSVATAIASAAAATLWSYEPTLSGPDLMQELYNASVDLNRAADACLGNNCRNQRRISMCSVVQAACSGGACATSCTVRPAFDDARPSAITPPAGYQPTVINTLLDSSLSVTACNADVYYSSGTTLTNPCPGTQYVRYFASSTVRPQPHEPICPACTINQSSVLDIELAQELPGPLSDPTLVTIDNSAVKEFHVLDINPNELVASAQIQYTDLNITMNTIEEVFIEFAVDGTTSSSDPVIITQ